MARTDTIKFHILSQALNDKRNTNNRVGIKSRDFGPLTVVRARAPYNPISQSFKSLSIAGHEQAPGRSSIWGFEFEWATTGYGRFARDIPYDRKYVFFLLRGRKHP